MLGYTLPQFLTATEFLIEDCTRSHVRFLLHSIAKYTFADVRLAYKQDLMLGVAAKDELISIDYDFDAGDLARTSHRKESRRDGEVRIVT